LGVPDVDVPLVPWNAVTKSAVMVRSHAVRAAAIRCGRKRPLRRAGVKLSSCVRTDGVHRQAVLLNRVNPGLMHVRNVHPHQHLRARGVSWHAGTLVASWIPLPARSVCKHYQYLCRPLLRPLLHPLRVVVLGDRCPVLCYQIGTAAFRFGHLHVLVGPSGILRSQSQTVGPNPKDDSWFSCSDRLQRLYVPRALVGAFCMRSTSHDLER